MYKVAVCDDEIDCAYGIAKILENQFTQKSFNAKVTIVTDKQDIIYKAIEKNEIDILILDIVFKNAEKNGIDFANELRKINKDFCLVFLSAHIRYMHLSFVSKTFDFLVKPISKNLMDSFVDRLIDEFSIKNTKFLHLNKGLVVKIDSIVYIEKIRNKSYIHTLTDTYSSTITLDKLLDNLPNNFVKCYRSYIANKNLISTIDNKRNTIIFENGLKCPINSHFKLEE
ncbi:MAG: response regulator [Clostridia bacterium]|jgi:DNA-binding LytR/AlgR family response regulator|nr:response regulator [Clostridia bacterium]